MGAGMTAAQLGWFACHTCGQLSRGEPQSGDIVCPRCGSHLHLRKPASVSRTWAYLIAAVVLYIPANTLAIMETSSLFGSQRDTIMSGVAYLWSSGSWHLALVVFIASVVVPLLKILAIVVLLLSVQYGYTRHAQQRAKLYRVIEFIGRWSMLDIYVVAILVTLVQLKGLASIKAAPGAIAFGAVVVLTMFSAMAFDPRLIWDPVKQRR
jgi:paraquat-inducible protein A